MDKKQPKIYPTQKKVLDKEVFIFLALFLAFFCYLGSEMGVPVANTQPLPPVSSSR